MAKKVVIDCDVGLDDAFALILAFHSSELEVKAITGVNGNVPMHQVFENIKRILSLIQQPEKPLIARGANQPLKGKTLYAHSVHGKTDWEEQRFNGRKEKNGGGLIPLMQQNSS